MKHHLITALAAVLALQAYAQSNILSPHSAIMSTMVASRAASQEMVSAYLTIDPATLDKAQLDALGIKVCADLGETLTVRMPISAINEITNVQGVEYVQVATPVSQTVDIAREQVGASKVQAGSDERQAYTGKGVVVGIVDAGFDYNHAAFSDAQGHLRIKRVWEQGGTGTYPAPEKFGYGVEMTREEDIRAAAGDIPNNSHGTHVTSLAAGSDSYLDGALRGMAPDADIVLVGYVSAGAGNVNISDAIIYIFDYAQEVGKPCVINLSLGAHSGPHDGTSTFDMIANRLQGPGRLIVGASGNFGADDFHVSHTFTAEQPQESIKTLVHQKSTKLDGSIEVWADAGMDIDVALVCYKISPLGENQKQVVYPAESDAPIAVSLGRNITGDITVATEISQLNGKPHVLINTSNLNIRTGYALGIEVTSRTKGRVDIWADDSALGLTSRDIEGFTDATAESTLGEIGGTAERILTVGAYTTRNDYLVLGEEKPRSLNETDGGICSFSSQGPTADGRTKPDITSPGCYIVGAVSQYDHSGTLTLAHYHKDTGYESYYGYMQGTSMASPIVAGIVATWLEACPELRPEALKDIVYSTAVKDAFTGDVSVGSNVWGYGKIDAYAGLLECLKLNAENGITDITTDSANGVIISTEAGRVRLTFTSAQAWADVEIYDTTGRLVSSTKLSGIGAGAVESLDTYDLSAGIYILNVKTANGRQAASIKL